MQEAVIKAFADKVPKVVIAAVDIVTTALRSVVAIRQTLCQANIVKQTYTVCSLLCSCSLFGVKVVSPQPLLKSLPKLFEAKQEPVRDGAKNLTVHLSCSIVAANRLPVSCQMSQQVMSCPAA